MCQPYVSTGVLGLMEKEAVSGCHTHVSATPDFAETSMTFPCEREIRQRHLQPCNNNKFPPVHKLQRVSLGDKDVEVQSLATRKADTRSN